MRDGVRLSATLYMPKHHVGPLPLVVTLTPYVSDSHHARAVYFATRGLPFAIVDVRGRGNSEGVFRPMIQEAQDGYDTVEWFARQNYCNGKVAMWGGSYLGYCQWATAKERPPHLATIVPTAAPCAAVDFPMRNNIFSPFLVQWLTVTSGRAFQGQIFSDTAFWSDTYREWHESGRPFRELDAMAGNPSSIFQEWLAHPEPDAYWDTHNPSADQCAKIGIPVLTITGSYDDDQPGALAHYQQHVRNAAPEARARHYLVIGPWDHAGTVVPRVEFGGLKLDSASALDIQRLHLEWYAWTMQDGPKPDFLQGQMAYYVMGAERWRYAETLEAATSRHESYFLSSAGSANDVFGSGSLRCTPGEGPPDRYIYDPCDCSGAEIDAEARASGHSLVDQRVTFALSSKQLIYHSAPFTEDTEITGFFKLSAWIAIDCPDTDLYVSVHEVALDGSSIRLSTDVMRARYREGLRRPKLIQTREPLRYDFDRFTFVSRRMTKGHRLRLIIAPMGRLIESTFVQKNYNAGRVVSEESARDGRPVTVRLFHDDAYPSALYVPIGQPE
jgi:putative CocE/NonD family hydrolase